MASLDDNFQGVIDSVVGGDLLIDSQSSSDAANEDSNNYSKTGIHGLNKNNDKVLIKKEA